MQFTFVPITQENLDQALTLHVSAAQKGTVETVAASFAEAQEIPLWRPVLLQREGENFGFAMYGEWVDEYTGARVWLDRFLIDEGFQGKGLATQVLPALLAYIRAAYHCADIYLSVYEDNAPAIHLYQKFGFSFTGELDMNGEKVMVAAK